MRPRDLRPRRRPLSLAVFLTALIALAFAGGAQAATPSRILYVSKGRFDFITPAGKPVGTVPIAERQFFGPDDLAVSRGGRRIAMLQPDGAAGEAFGRFDLFVHFAGKPGVKEIPLKKGQDTVVLPPSLAISPDGSMLAVSVGPSIELIDLDTGHRHLLRREGILTPDAQPSFTADGRHLVFTHESSGEEAAVDIYESNLNGGELRRLTDTPAKEEYPELSPDGRQLTFLRRTGGGYEVVVASDEDTEERVLGRSDYALGGPSFSPDGKQIVFTAASRSDSHEASGFTIFTAAVEGGAPQAILKSKSGPLLAGWVPAGG
jgi:dipeptidyl aminopeptidase/acylaminoacyl peptidase